MFFGEGGADRMSEKYGVPVLGHLPSFGADP